MSTSDLDRLEYGVKRIHQGGYFVSALSQLIDKVGTQDPGLCDEVVNGYVLGGLVAGLDMVGVELMGRCEELESLIQEIRNAAPQKKSSRKRGAEVDGDQ